MKNNNYVPFLASNPFGSQAKLLVHIDRLHEYLKTGDTTPIFMEINLTNKCNLKCKWCISSNTRGFESIEINALERFFESFKKIGGKAVTFSGGGEPTLYKEFKRATLSAKKEGLDIGLMTNGNYLKQYKDVIGNNFDWIRFSVDTLDKNNYKKWKGGGSLDNVVSNIIALKNYSVKVGVNCNIGEDLSIYETRELINFVCDNDNADYLQFRPVLPRYFKNEKLNLNDKVWEYLKDFKDNPKINFSYDKFQDLNTKNTFPFRSCEGHYFEPILDATGEVKVCIYHPKDDRFTFGNIYKNSFNEIWQSNQRQKVIKNVRKIDYATECQMCCKLTEPNKLIDFLKHPEEVLDKNFL